MEEVKETTALAEHKTVHKKSQRISLKAAQSVFAIMLGVIICLSATVIILAMKIGSEPPAESAEEIVTEAETEEPAIQAFIPVVNDRVYDFFSKEDTIILEDPIFGKIWIPALTSVPRHTYDYSGLVLENDGRYTYSEDDEIISKTGIDVSYHQGYIDWRRVAADGIDFVMIRVGYRGYETGDMMLDENFHTYIKGALNAGLDVGVYFYSQAVNTEESIAEANFVMEQIHGYDITYPVVYDWEIAEAETARTNDSAPYSVTECAAAFCDTIRDGGYTPMVYANRKQALLKMDMSKLADVDFWFAEYKNGHHEPSYPYDFQMWQYASDGIVNGIDGEVDLNICFLNSYGRTNEEST